MRVKRGRGWIGVLFAGAAFAAAAAPLVSPDRLADVADTDPDPFPAFDEFAWRAFLALNWPAGAASLNASGPRVWERFAPREAALGRGGNPCGAPEGEKVVSAFTPYAEFNQTTFTPGVPDSPLVARNGTYVRYETRFDPLAVEALAHGPAPLPEGAVAVKAAWRVLTPADPASVRARAYVAEGVWITDVGLSRAAGRVVCARADLALVGLHIVVRTKTQPQGIWASFEQVDNVPPAGLGEAREPDARAEGIAYSFNNPRAPQREIWPPQGWQAAAPLGADNPPRPDPAPSQVMRLHPIRRGIMATNRAFWALPDVRDSVWRRYMLVSVQWPTRPEPRGPENDARYFPGLKPEPDSKAAHYKVDEAEDASNLANSVMETYRQDAPANCMGCHHAVANARGFDFVGVLSALPARD